jgi:NAD(P)-dependent dehydrogenase (short-subunit alcohol dehydrogenase family)
MRIGPWTGGGRSRSSCTREASGTGRAAALAFAPAGTSVVVADVADAGNQERRG